VKFGTIQFTLDRSARRNRERSASGQRSAVSTLKPLPLSVLTSGEWRDFQGIQNWK
jgi:hypothetical protein